MARVFHKLRLILEMIRFSHSVFALPFALMGMLLAARGWPPARTVFWIVVACVFARSAAMAFNRLVDRRFDATNPRTASRALPAGLISRGFVRTFTLVCIGGFVGSAAMLNPLCLWLSPFALAVLLGYSFTKRFTRWSHVFLGLALGIAPIGAWIATRGELGLPPLLLGFGVLQWTAGFDVIYACQDYEHDLTAPLHSIPKSLGISGALRLSEAMHAVAFLSFLSVYWVGDLGGFYLIGVAATGALLLYEHSIVRPNDLSRVNTAFFTVNGLISIGLFAMCWIDIALRSAPVQP